MYLDETTFWCYFNYLKALGLDSYLGWNQHTARKEHTDIHKVTIEKGEEYFDVTIKQQTLKFSRKSMDEYLYLLFEGTPFLKQVGERLLDDTKQKIKEAIEKMPL